MLLFRKIMSALGCDKRNVLVNVGIIEKDIKKGGWKYIPNAKGRKLYGFDKRHYNDLTHMRSCLEDYQAKIQQVNGAINGKH